MGERKKIHKNTVSFHVFCHCQIFCGVISGNIKFPGAAGDETLVFGNTNFAQQSGFGKGLVYCS